MKIAGAVLGTAVLALIVWTGTVYIAGQDVRGRLITSEVVSDESVTARLEVSKGPDAEVVCTLRSVSKSGHEVGREDVRFTQHKERLTRQVQFRTIDRATMVELVGCQDIAAG
nr:DUF4307 domain-containing protein [Streptomyces coelicoflavus]